MQSNKLVSALASVGRRFLGTPERKRAKYLATSAHYRSNGNREVCRRLRQEIRSLAKRAIEEIKFERHGIEQTTYMSLWDQLKTDPAYMLKFRNATRDQLLDIRNNLINDLKGASNG